MCLPWMTQSWGVRTSCVMSSILVTIHLCGNLPTRPPPMVYRDKIEQLVDEIKEEA